MQDLHWLSVRDIHRAYRANEISPTELTRALLARIERLQPVLHAFIRVDAEGALGAARAAESEISAGRWRGALHGVPVGIKDIIDVAGLPTTAHSRVLIDNIAGEDAVVTAKLRAAGAIILGKLATHEFAIGGPSHDLPWPAARNPWNPNHHPGGSSSGSGAGLAAGLFPLALGTDTGGSVRNPASACGIIGLKPTYGLVSRRGVFPLSFTLDHIGPMTRGAADNALLLDTIAGHDPNDPGSAATQEQNFGRELGLGVRGLRIGFIRHFHEADMPAHPEVSAALETVKRVLETDGALVRTTKLPPLAEFAAVNRVIQASEAWTIHAKWLREQPQNYGQLARQRLLPGAFIPASAYVNAQRCRLTMISAVNEAFREHDVLMCASAMDPASNIFDAEETARTYPRQARTPFNVTGHPALAMCAGFSSGGLPLSVQFVGPYFAEAMLLRVAAAYERATDWHKRRPPLP